MSPGAKSRCAIAHCKVWRATVGEVGCFCEHHAQGFEQSREGERVLAAPQHLRSDIFMAALVDFRTRVELEHARDKDPQVVAAREGK